uniref:Uncharacterized protein n=1 Tax=Amphimedon queenslandica TaxID=400682 RepID=A0A1X7SNW3_AMPQE
MSSEALLKKQEIYRKTTNDSSLTLQYFAN